MTSTIRKDNWMGFKSLWLGFRIRAYSQGLGSGFRLSDSGIRVRVQPAVLSMQTRNC